MKRKKDKKKKIKNKIYGKINIKNHKTALSILHRTIRNVSKTINSFFL